MSFLTLKINSTDRNSIIEDFVYSNSLNGNPTIDINPSDVDNALFEIGNEVEIYNGATNLLSGDIKDMTSILLRGIETKSSRIHVRDLKEKIFNADLTSYTGLTNLQALTYICSQAGVTLSTSVTTTKKYAMDKEIDSQSFWRYVQNICASEGWGCYCSNDTLYVVDVLNSTSSYSLTNVEQIEHSYNDLNSYGNIIIKGIINKKRLVSEDNPYSDILSYNSLSSLSTFSITQDNQSSFLSILSVNSGVENLFFNNDGSFTFDLINATSISSTYDYNTFTITSSLSNIEILDTQKLLFPDADNVAEQCHKARLTCKTINETSQVVFVLDAQGKTINSYTNNLTPDTFTAIYKNNDADANSKERYLYYENRNIIDVSQIQNIISSLARETGTRILKIKVKIKTDHVFNLYDRLLIENINDNFNGYWSVYGFTCRRNARCQEWDLELVRSNTIIIPELNIYSKKPDNLYSSYINGNFKGIIINEKKNNVNDNLNLNSEKLVVCFIPALRKEVDAINKSNFNINKGQVCYLQKMPFSNNRVITSVDIEDLKTNPNKIQFYEGNSDVINGYNGGYTSALETDWETTGINTTPTTKPYSYTETSLEFVSKTVDFLGTTGSYKITLTMNKSVNPSTINPTSFIFL